jgi:hypothetical protein
MFNFSLMSVMQINLSDSEISGTSNASSNNYHSNKSTDMDALMNNLTLGKPSHGSSAKNVPDGHSSVNGVKKTDFFGGKK